MLLKNVCTIVALTCREERLLDVSIWNEECSAGIATTGGGVPMEGGNAISVNGIHPPIGRFVRIYIGRRNGGADISFSLSLSLSLSLCVCVCVNMNVKCSCVQPHCIVLSSIYIYIYICLNSSFNVQDLMGMGHHTACIFSLEGSGRLVDSNWFQMHQT